MHSDSHCENSAYFMAQMTIALLRDAPDDGLKNSQIGRQLGIYMGHVEHEGHIPRTLLAIMESEGVVEQDEATKHWRLTTIAGRRTATSGQD